MWRSAFKRFRKSHSDIFFERWGKRDFRPICKVGITSGLFGLVITIIIYENVHNIGRYEFKVIKLLRIMDFL